MADFMVGDRIRYRESFLSDSPMADILRAKVFVVVTVEPMRIGTVPLFLGVPSSIGPGQSARAYFDARIMEVVNGD